MNKDNKIISFNEKILERERENYIASIRISFLRFPIIGDFVFFKSTLDKKDSKLLMLGLLRESYKKLKKRIRNMIIMNKFHIEVSIDFYMNKNKDIYFRANVEDEILMYILILSINALEREVEKLL